MTKVADYERWLHREAYRLLHDSQNPMYDDVIQEGRIAMWQDEKKNGQSHAGFMTHAARLRMRSSAWDNRKAFGGIKVAVRDVRPVTSLDSFAPSVTALLSPEEDDIADQAMWAYHRGEILAALNRLSPRQREAAECMLTDGKMTAQQRAAWTDARRKLRTELAALNDGYGDA